MTVYLWYGLSGHVCIRCHVFLQLSSSSKYLISILQDKSSWQTDRKVLPLKSKASGHLKNKKGTYPVLILATHHHTTESVCIVVTGQTWQEGEPKLLLREHECQTVSIPLSLWALNQFSTMNTKAYTSDMVLLWVAHAYTQLQKKVFTPWVLEM